MSTWWSVYPGDCLAAYDSTGAITAWIDCKQFSEKPVWMPDTSATVAVTAAQWQARVSSFWRVENGELVIYTPAPVIVPLKTQAQNAQAWIQQQANLTAAMGEVFTAEMKAYVKAIAAIANGTDTTSTALPAQPTDVMAIATS